ncbi:DODA-type extradiol aromatic ring-opening family dioxygenase [Alicyclobacillus fastidiosus]|uniref:Extradiol ring-cleavage dioxygenase class III enzyme subunit B domain-containing protein n=1 Tax=Alicyclobacillus fastidiosus TaxID=392011 RepID=A0ABV5AAG1_9BACL|nr:hypothetical protein [Alicyclobacillus fastidiosus]WEH07604.1 hypothetical protein PYS47_12565 [Alicyclobacillus fastidiosus]
MAKIVLGIGSSHSPQVSSPSDVWAMHAQRDRENPDTQYEARERELAHVLQDQLSPELWQQKYEQCQVAVAHLNKVIEDVKPDVLVVVGDDQEELFWDEVKPTFAVFWGSEIKDLPHNLEELHPSLRPVIWAWHTTDEPVHYPTEGDLGRHILECMVTEGFDVAQSKTQLENRSLGHAYTFVKRRLAPQQDIPTVPVFVNCFYPPNQPTPARCYEFGRALRRAIESWDQDKTVAIVGSGGLSHFKLDEKLDELVIQGLKDQDAEILKNLPREKLEGASGEILNWIVAAGALEHLSLQYLEYVSGYRSPAGTGVGMTFAVWQ